MADLIVPTEAIYGTEHRRKTRSIPCENHIWRWFQQATVNGTVAPGRPPQRRPNAEARAREYLTDAEVQKLIAFGGAPKSFTLAAAVYRTTGRRSRRRAFITGSSRSRCPRTRSGGVSAIQLLRDTSLYFGLLKTLRQRIDVVPMFSM